MRGKAYLGFILVAGMLLVSILPLWAKGEYLGNELNDLASPSPSPSPPKEAAPSFTEMSVRMFIVLTIIIGLIILLGFFMPGYHGEHGPRPASGELFRCAGRQDLNNGIRRGPLIPEQSD